jgi:hypothetical protein
MTAKPEMRIGRIPDFARGQRRIKQADPVGVVDEFHDSFEQNPGLVQRWSYEQKPRGPVSAEQTQRVDGASVGLAPAAPARKHLDLSRVQKELSLPFMGFPNRRDPLQKAIHSAQTAEYRQR